MLLPGWRTPRPWHHPAPQATSTLRRPCGVARPIALAGGHRPPVQISPVTKRSQVSSLKSPSFRLLDPALIANVLMILRAVAPPVGNHHVFMLVTRGAAAEQSQNLGTHVPELVPLPWQDRNRISGNDIADFLINANPSHPMRDVINLLLLASKCSCVLAPGASRASARL